MNTMQILDEYERVKMAKEVAIYELKAKLRLNLHEYRKMRGNTTQARMAELAGVSQSLICNFEKGLYNTINDRTLVRIVELYESLGAKHER